MRTLGKTHNTCTRCGKKHLNGWVYLELNTRTNVFAKPGEVPQEDSQGLFRFGTTCARRELEKKQGTHNDVR